MKIIHVLHHSISSFTGQYPERDILRYDSGFPMEFARETRKRCSEVELECWRPESAVGTEYQWYDEMYQINHRVFPSFLLHYGLELSIPMIQAVRKQVEAGRTWFVVHGSYNLHAYLFASLLVHSPAILQSHGGLPAALRIQQSQPRWKKGAFGVLAVAERLSLHRYPHIFAINMREKRGIEECFPDARVSLSPVAIDFDLFSPGEMGVSRSRLGLEPASHIALYVGRLAKGKGLEYLLEATAFLRESIPDFALYLVGSGPLEIELHRKAAELGLADSVRFVGYRSKSKLVDWYRAANVVCVPSLFEGFGLSAAEAMACGTPVVAARSAGTEDVVRLFDGGILVPPQDVASLSRALEKTFLDAEHPKLNINNARQVLDWSAKLQTMNRVFCSKAGSVN